MMPIFFILLSSAFLFVGLVASPMPNSLKLPYNSLKMDSKKVEASSSVDQVVHTKAKPSIPEDSTTIAVTTTEAPLEKIPVMISPIPEPSTTAVEIQGSTTIFEATKGPSTTENTEIVQSSPPFAPGNETSAEYMAIVAEEKGNHKKMYMIFGIGGGVGILVVIAIVALLLKRASPTKRDTYYINNLQQVR